MIELLAVLGSESPATFVAITENVYDLPFAKPVHIAVVPVTAHDPSAGLAVAVYDVTVAPPLFTGATQVRSTAPSLGVPTTVVGAFGIVRGVIGLGFVPGSELPDAFVAITENVYGVPLFRPVHDAVVSVTTHDPSAGLGVTV